MASRTVLVRTTSEAPMLVFSCAMVVAPMITDVMKGRVRQKARAIWAGSRPCVFARRVYFSTMACVRLV